MNYFLCVTRQSTNIHLYRVIKTYHITLFMIKLYVVLVICIGIYYTVSIVLKILERVLFIHYSSYQADNKMTVVMTFIFFYLIFYL